MTRLSPERLSELYRGTLALLAERGFAGLTMDELAERTRSSKATLYRQWGSKARLVVEALRCTALAERPVPDTGTLRGDLVEMTGDRVPGVDRETDIVAAILHAVREDEELRRAVRADMVGTFRSRLDTVLRRAVERGEVDADNPAIAHVPLVLMAPYVLGILVEDAPIDDAGLVSYVDAVVLPALGVHPSVPSTR